MQSYTSKKGAVIYLVPKKINNEKDIKSLFRGQICICDFHVKNCELGHLEKTLGDKPRCIRYQDILIIDHHADIHHMRKRITSTTLAKRYVRKYGPLGVNSVILINHLDCDSILSSLIMSGEISNRKKYVTASIDSDHTGMKNILADIINSQFMENNLKESILSVLEYEQKQTIRHKASQLLSKREIDRKNALELSNQFKKEGAVYYFISKEPANFDAALFVPFFKHAKVILIATPLENKLWNIKIRLGRKAKNIHLNNLNLPKFGGRWNAGGTGWEGGTKIHPKKYAKLINDKI
jgi:hypothetical protein